jgi:hypothetical protein
MRVEKWPLAIVVADRNLRAVGTGQEPVPVQDCQIEVLPGGRMPPQQVVVVRADLTDPIMMANVVVIGLWERDAQ